MTLTDAIGKLDELEKTQLASACGAPFDPACFTDYLTKKFTELYGL